jgi:hypothetical protein
LKNIIKLSQTLSFEVRFGHTLWKIQKIVCSQLILSDERENRRKEERKRVLWLELLIQVDNEGNFPKAKSL